MLIKLRRFADPDTLGLMCVGEMTTSRNQSIQILINTCKDRDHTDIFAKWNLSRIYCWNIQQIYKGNQVFITPAQL